MCRSASLWCQISEKISFATNFSCSRQHKVPRLGCGEAVTSRLEHKASQAGRCGGCYLTPGAQSFPGWTVWRLLPVALEHKVSQDGRCGGCYLSPGAQSFPGSSVWRLLPVAWSTKLPRLDGVEAVICCLEHKASQAGRRGGCYL